ncbi:site-specific integrase [Variovorax boronicumulans]|uniref:site-specific integrase n=1 Tax=Variovorax boronicumulans TaxID=436515 RepID=UPI001CC10058|nr:site-specific integrase [Variovorax boronicumulans]
MAKKQPSALVQGYAAASASESTRRSYLQDMRHYKAWGGKVPATPEIVAEYLAAHAQTLAIATLRHRVVALHRAHVDRNLESPVRHVLVKRTFQGICRLQGVKQRQVDALVMDDIVELLVTISKQKPLKAARDKAILLLGFASACRRSELVAFRVEDITPHSHGLELMIRRSKTDAVGEGRTVFVPMAHSEARCPVHALRSWLELAGIGEGPLFRQVSRHDQIVGADGLTPQSVALVIKAAVTKAKGVDAAKSFAGHSLRAGFVTAASMAGFQAHTIMGQTGHRTLEMVMRYQRKVNKRQIPSLL